MKFQLKPKSTTFGKLHKVWKQKCGRKELLEKHNNEGGLLYLVLKHARINKQWKRTMKPDTGLKQTEADSRIRSTTKARTPRRWERLKHPTGPGRKEEALANSVTDVSLREGLWQWCGWRGTSRAIRTPELKSQEGEASEPGYVAAWGGYRTATMTFPRGMQKEASWGSQE